jgi:hypothetical protein
MKNKIKLLIPIVLIGILLAPAAIRADYGVGVGEVYTYDVVTSTWSLKAGSNSGEGTGYPFAGAKFGEGTSIDVEVLSVDPTMGVSYEATAGTKTQTGSNSPFDMLGIFLYCFYPFLISSSMSMTWNQTEVEMGPDIIAMYFFDAETASDFFMGTLANDTSMASMATESGFTLDRMEGHFDNSTSEVVFDWVIEGSIEYTEDNTDLSGYELLQFVFDKDDGYLLGYQIDMDFEGTTEGEVFEIDLDQKVEKAGFNLDSFYYETGGLLGGFIPGYEWGIGLFAIASISVIAILIKRKK